MEKLTKSDWQMISESLKYSKLKFEEYQNYPTQEFKQKRIQEVVDVNAKVNSIRKNT
ncbi:hypothetical protein K6119_01720 [Paracrocinitomix mangrovi]|uniref:hypothetical protein n=1 Tax=Paracrocinitomix mangrovi TaxID=2862509 RepID=UPI001C8E7510|nr:hypothetical protein [Paracrocinitomix mangrovi]UKN02235.1 hypothetical protein K6119_01720 [Paracrocinitomix mangrovi]